MAMAHGTTRMVLTDDQLTRARRIARLVQVPLDDLLVRLIDDGLRSVGAAIPPDPAERRWLADQILAARPMEVPEDPADLRREIDESHALWFER